MACDSSGRTKSRLEMEQERDAARSEVEILRRALFWAVDQIDCDFCAMQKSCGTSDGSCMDMFVAKATAEVRG
jgi:hypothetical protein